MREASILAVFIVFFIIQLSLHGVLFSFEFANLTLLFVLASVNFGGLRQAIVLCVIGGVLLDFFSSAVDGSFLLGLLLAVVVVYFFVLSISAKENLLPFLIGSVVLGTVSFWLPSMALGYETFAYGYFFGRQIWFELLFNLVLAYPVFVIYNSVNNYFKQNK